MTKGATQTVLEAGYHSLMTAFTSAFSSEADFRGQVQRLKIEFGS